MEKRYQVFVSSTYADLKDERHKVFQTLMELDCIPAGMELFPATDEDQFEFIKKIIDDCDYYLLIIGGRYGSLTEQGISYTEQEYEYALERELKVIALLHQDPNKLALEKSESDPALRSRLQAFREKASAGRLVKFWNNAEELPGIVALSLSKTIKMHPAIGWVRADKVSSEELLFEINELRKQNLELNKSLSEIEPSIFTGSEEQDFSFIYGKLNRFEEIYLKNKAESPTLNNDIGNVDDAIIEKYSINLASLIPFITTSTMHKFSWYSISDLITGQLSKSLTSNSNMSLSRINNMPDELLMYGLLTHNYIPPASNTLKSFIPDEGKFQLIFSEKFERYKYWLNVNKKMPECIEINKIDP